MEPFDRYIDRAVQLLQYVDEAEVASRLVGDGCDPQTAYLIVKAAAIVVRTQEPDASEAERVERLIVRHPSAALNLPRISGTKRSVAVVAGQSQ